RRNRRVRRYDCNGCGRSHESHTLRVAERGFDRWAVVDYRSPDLRASGAGEGSSADARGRRNGRLLVAQASTKQFNSKGPVSSRQGLSFLAERLKENGQARRRV